MWTHMDSDVPWVRLEPDIAVVGQKTEFTAQAGDETGGLQDVSIRVSQGELEKILLDRSFPPGGEGGVAVSLPFALEPKKLGLQDGPVLLTIEARDRPWQKFFKAKTTVLTRELLVDLVPITVEFQKTGLLLYAGGTGLMCYRLNRAPRESGVRIGGRLYRGFPNPGGNSGDYVVLFPVPMDAQGEFPVELVGEASVGNSRASQTVTLTARPRKWRERNIRLSDNFLSKVQAGFDTEDAGDPLSAFLLVNRTVRRQNGERIAKACSESRDAPLWNGPFERFRGATMARFGDQRTYVYDGKKVDKQVHLGEDLASNANSTVEAENNGVVVLAEPVGIYGKTVILDHGLGVFSSYSHLSTMDVEVGQAVAKGDVIGQTGKTGLAGGDHLHFSIILQGTCVDPREWWDGKWLQDQVEDVWKSVPSNTSDE